jgi:hypothetical protein
LIFVFNAESPTNIAVQNETEEGIIQATAGYSITINCSVSSGIPNGGMTTLLWVLEDRLLYCILSSLQEKII